MSDIELKACSCCGATEPTVGMQQGMGESWVLCETTEGGCGLGTKLCNTLKQAADSWNRRTLALRVAWEDAPLKNAVCNIGGWRIGAIYPNSAGGFDGTMYLVEGGHVHPSYIPERNLANERRAKAAVEAAFTAYVEGLLR